jgi:putative FmdB family regulatory protein
VPLYEYQCTKCGRRVEKIQSFTAAPLTVCEACGGPMERLISAPAFQFKGSGWYVTDYAKKSGSSPASHEPHHDGAKTETKAETKSESKPEPSTTAAAPAASSPQK